MTESPKSEHDFSVFSEEDFAQIDVLTSTYFGQLSSKGGPQVRVELEASDQKCHKITPSASAKYRNGYKKTPIDLYRPSCVLSVSDLVSPVWCEVQFDYGLRQKRSKPLESRPDSFISASGKEIFVEKKVAARNDAITTQGKVVHKKLEEQLGFKEVEVNITSLEERWALRILNLITGIEAILAHGFTRELPVFGIVHDQVVVGVIDEVTRCPHPKSKRTANDTLSNTGKKQKGGTTAQALIDDFFHSQHSPKKKAMGTHTYSLLIMDTKTRRTDSLPSHDDALPSRLQLMLYHRLLSSLLSEYPPFDFSSLWDRLRLNSAALFSTQFLAAAVLITDSRQERTACLDDLATYWHRIVQELDVVGVDPELQLVYRLQPGAGGAVRRTQKKPTRKPRAEPTFLISQEDRELALAIETSLQDFKRHKEEQKQEIAQDSNIADGAANGNSEFNPSHTRGASNPRDAGVQAQEIHNGDATECDEAVEDETDISNTCAAQSGIIGSKQFLYNENLLDDHIANILHWWHGQREPRGVPIHLSRRCFTCEYSMDCEWREEKASDFSKSIEEKSNARASPRPVNNLGRG